MPRNIVHFIINEEQVSSFEALHSNSRAKLFVHDVSNQLPASAGHGYLVQVIIYEKISLLFYVDEKLITKI